MSGGQMQSPDAIAELARIWKRYEGDPDEVRAGFAGRDFGDIPRYSFSAGISELGVDGADAMELVGRADLRLYEAKHLGRDRTISAG
jgi:GGDEF domain-containing protein